MTLYERIETLCKENNINITVMCKRSGASRGSLTDLKKGRKKTLSTDTLNLIADYFNVSFDTLLGKTSPQMQTPALTKKDERDIAKDLEQLQADLESSDTLLFDGEPLDRITRELLILSIENSLELSKRIAKEKYTLPKNKE